MVELLGVLQIGKHAFGHAVVYQQQQQLTLGRRHGLTVNCLHVIGHATLHPLHLGQTAMLNDVGRT